MTPAKIVPIVEGPGEMDAVPNLLQRLLHSRQRYDVFVTPPKNAHGLGNLTGAGEGDKAGLERFLRYAATEPGVVGILVLADADTDCTLKVANSLVGRARELGLNVPVAVVAAKIKYESWLLASIETIRGQQLTDAAGCTRPGIAPDAPPVENVEDGPEPKGWLTQYMPSGYAYKETSDQLPLTRLMSFDAVRPRSRSFRALEEALDFLLAHLAQGPGLVSPDPDVLAERLLR